MVIVGALGLLPGPPAGEILPSGGPGVLLDIFYISVLLMQGCGSGNASVVSFGIWSVRAATCDADAQRAA